MTRSTHSNCKEELLTCTQHAGTMLKSTADEVVVAFETLKKMYSARGYDIRDSDGMGSSQLKEMVTRMPVIVLNMVVVDRKSGLEDELRVMFNLLAKVRMSDIAKRLHAEANNIIVVRERIPPNSLKSLKDISYELFELRELQYNIIDHVLVPKHEVITDEAEIATLVTEYNAKSKLHFPLLLRSDPVARYLGVKSGQLVRITRTSPSAGEYVLYRCCV